MCHAVMRVKVFIRGPFTDVTLSPDRSHSCTFVTAEVKNRNRSGKLRQLFAILSRIFCHREKQNGPIAACQSTITSFCCSEVDLLLSPVSSGALKRDGQSATGAIPVQRLNTGIAPSPSRVWKESRRFVSYPRKEFISRDVSRWICLP